MRSLLKENFIFASLLLLIVFFGLVADNFFSLVTLRTILNQLPALTVVTVGMTLVLVVGGIDLSVGSVLGFCATIVGVAMMNWDFSIVTACFLAIGAGIICGSVNGILAAYLALPSFIVTLGMLEMARGMAYITTDSQTMYIGASIQKLALPISGTGVSPALVIALSTVFAAQFILTRTVPGRHIVAVGANTRAARMSGIDTKLTVCCAGRTGALAGLGGIFNAASGGSRPERGRRHGVGGNCPGHRRYQPDGRARQRWGHSQGCYHRILQNGLAQLGVSEPAKRLITGGVIIIAVFIDSWRIRRDRMRTG